MTRMPVGGPPGLGACHRAARPRPPSRAALTPNQPTDPQPAWHNGGQTSTSRPSARPIGRCARGGPAQARAVSDSRPAPAGQAHRRHQPTKTGPTRGRLTVHCGPDRVLSDRAGPAHLRQDDGRRRTLAGSWSTTTATSSSPRRTSTTSETEAGAGIRPIWTPFATG